MLFTSSGVGEFPVSILVAGQFLHAARRKELALLYSQAIGNGRVQKRRNEHVWKKCVRTLGLVIGRR